METTEEQNCESEKLNENSENSSTDVELKENQEEEQERNKEENENLSTSEKLTDDEKAKSSKLRNAAKDSEIVNAKQYVHNVALRPEEPRNPPNPPRGKLSDPNAVFH